MSVDLEHEPRNVNEPNVNNNTNYRRKLLMLIDECTKVHRSNELLVFRIQEVDKIVKRRCKEVDLFKRRLLNNYGEDWSTMPNWKQYPGENKNFNKDDNEEEDSDSTTHYTLATQLLRKRLKQEQATFVDDVNIVPPTTAGVGMSTNIKIKQEGIKIEENAIPISVSSSCVESNKTSMMTATTKSTTATPTPTKKPKVKRPRDPNAPKRPSNPFFQYCQEQRQRLMEELTANRKPGDVELTKQELTRQLAIRWKTLTQDDKKIYVDRYEYSKEQYTKQMTEYKNKMKK